MRPKFFAQHQFLREMMDRLGMTPDELAERLGTSRRRLDSWLLAPDSPGYQEMEEGVWKYLREISQSRD